jgi:hypothetical protein
MAIFGARLLAVQFAADYFTVGLWRRLSYPMLAILAPIGIAKLFISH